MEFLLLSKTYSQMMCFVSVKGEGKHTVGVQAGLYFAGCFLSTIIVIHCNTIQCASVVSLLHK